MKSLIPLIFFFICSNLYAYQPKLMLLGSLENKGESFIDVNAHQKIRDSFKQAVIYEKYANPIKDEQGATYQSVIKQLIVDCTGKTIAIRGADYFAGKTSNSKLVKKFDDILNGINTTRIQNLVLHASMVVSTILYLHQ